MRARVCACECECRAGWGCLTAVRRVDICSSQSEGGLWSGPQEDLLLVQIPNHREGQPLLTGQLPNHRGQMLFLGSITQSQEEDSCLDVMCQLQTRTLVSKSLQANENS